ncbi:DNA-binding transcriptional LysR family regulator [Rhizobium sp. BK650]|uniref:LysR family transcriptional regulator n=1 Tax=Rhizobium sp. BK650 TaxID=2586990 RepID=UPI0016229862|nr:LysR family transcriptional regulator [Rhizobium sp. BK650]MBB3656959.1 DNA-binding transcriptional LysR family regulator [Rhizobium sp. BK650]
MDSLSSLSAFVHAAERQSYVAAARVAGVSPSAIAKSISRLEARLGVRLFNRTTRNISLTEEGAVFYERCKRIIDDLEDAEASLIESRKRPRGRLRVSVPHIVGRHLLMPILPAFVERYPEIELDIDFEDRVADLVAEGLDVAVRSGELADTSLIARRLGEQHFVVCGSPGYFDRRKVPMVPADLAEHACIHFKYPTSGRLAPWAFAPHDEKLILPRSLTFNNTDAGLRAALDGLGIAHLPIYVAAAHIRRGSLVPVLTSYMVAFGSLSLVWPSNRQLSPKVRAFVDFVAQRLAARPDAFQAAAARPRIT